LLRLIMDSNGLRFWMLSQRDEWLPPWRPNTPYLLHQGVVDASGNLQAVTNTSGDSKSAGAEPLWPANAGETVTDGNLVWTCQGPSEQASLFYCNKRRRLQLRSLRTGNPPSEDFNQASNLLNVTPMARDQFGNYARWDAANGQVVAGGSGSGEVPIYTPPPGAQITDLVLGYDGVLYVAVNGALVLIDRRNRWPNFTLSVANFNFWRLAAHPDDGVLALDRDKPQLAKVAGSPLRTGPTEQTSPGILRSCEQNPAPPQIVSRWPLPDAEFFVALAATEKAQFALLSWRDNNSANQTAYVHTFDESSGLGPPLQLADVCFPYSLAWLGGQRIAVFVTDLNEALIWDLEYAGKVVAAAGETYILAGVNLGPFVHGFDLPPLYARGKEMLPLLPLSLNSFAGSGGTDPAAPITFDSGTWQTVWHRVFLEAVIPAHCGVLVWMAASEKLQDLFGPATTWYPHAFGSPDLSLLDSEILPDIPRGVWQPVSSEVAFARVLLQETPLKDSTGLFMSLVQRAHKAVRNLRGRFLGIRVQLNGDRRSTPEIAALRVYASRFSYVGHYLPEIYHEDTFGPDADQDGASTRADFFERFVNLFELQFTRIEDRIASAYLLTRPESSPNDSLDWLGSWIGLDPGNPPAQARARLLDTSRLYQKRGTASGISDAIDVATNGMCRRGAVIVIEDFRLRHTFATILGADLSIKNDPLLPGYSPSSNSIVGDTLFLGDPSLQGELQALFAKDLAIAGAVQQAADFYDQLAHRMTVFVHDQVEVVDLNLIQRIVEVEKPAHVLATIRRASQPLLIGLASMLGVNTYLGPQPPRGAATLDASQIGRYDVVTHLPSLDPRLEGSGA
jgi:phage tail-like protein